MRHFRARGPVPPRRGHGAQRQQGCEGACGMLHCRPGALPGLSPFCCLAGAFSVLIPSLDLARIRAVTLDLDDTLWPIWPTIERAEAVLLQWMAEHAPATAQLFKNTEALRAIRNQMVNLRPDLAHDLSALRRESIRLALTQAGDDGALADA